MIARLFATLRGLLGRRRVEAEIIEELRDHLEREIEAHRSRGVSAEEARRLALRDLGGLTQTIESTRAVRATWLDTAWRDVGYAARGLIRNPAFAIPVIVTIALGVTLNITAFSIFASLLLQPLPVKDADRVVALAQTFDGEFTRMRSGPGFRFSYPEYEAYARVGAFDELSARWSTPLMMTAPGAEHVDAMLVTASYFRILQAPLALGRTFSDQETAGNRADVAVLHYGFWRRRFGSDPTIIGSRLTINGVPLTVVGVTGPSFVGAEAQQPDVFIPVGMHPVLTQRPGFMTMAAVGWLSVLGRLKPDLTPAQAEAMVRLEAARMDRDNPGRITTITLSRATLLSGDGLWMKILAIGGLGGGLMGLWLLMTCANAANLVLARSIGRRREFALRAALGATRPRLVRELMVENVLIAILAGALGLVGAAVLAPLVVAAGPFPLLAIDLSPDWRVYLFTLLLSFVSAVAFGTLPAVQSSRVDLQTVMKDDAAALGARGRGWSGHRTTLIAAQVALAFVLLASAAFVVRGFQAAEEIDFGFERRGLVTSPVDFAAVRGGESVALFQGGVADAMRARGDAIAFATMRPLSGAATVYVRHAGQGGPGADAIPVSQNHVSGDYFATLGIPILRGRAFTDDAADANTVVVSRVIASRMWPGENPVNKTIVVDERTHLVAGVAAEVRMTLSTDVVPMIYRPLTPDARAGASIIVRTADVPGAVAALRQAAAAIDSRVLVAPVSLEADLARRVRDEGRVQLALSAVVALLALVLTGSGIYSVVSYRVGQSMREIAVRVALGAGRSHVMALVMTRGMRPIVFGLVVGLLGAISAAQLLQGLMFGLSPLDPIALATALLFLGAVSGVAILIPTLRAVRMRPSDVLRS